MNIFLLHSGIQKSRGCFLRRNISIFQIFTASNQTRSIRCKVKSKTDFRATRFCASSATLLPGLLSFTIYIMLTSLSSYKTTLYRVTFDCFSKDSATELLQILRGIRIPNCFYIRQASFITAFLPPAYVRLLQACHRPAQCKTIRYFRLGSDEDIVIDIELNKD